MKIYLSFYSPDLKNLLKDFLSRHLKWVYTTALRFLLQDLNEDFKLYVKDLLKKGKKKGYGYWVWQTHIHQMVLSNLKEGDIYHWCDIGCHFAQKENKD